MVLGAILLLSLAAVFGLSLAVMGARYRRSSLALGLGHAGIGVLGLGLLAVQIFRGPVHMLYNNAAVLFLLVIVGGVVLLALREGNKPPPMVVAGLHGAMALVALALVVFGYLHR
jgi:hypothetical protein